MEEVHSNRERALPSVFPRGDGGKGTAFENEAIDSFAPERPAELGPHCLQNVLL